MSTAEKTLTEEALVDEEEVTRLRSAERVDRCDDADVGSSGCIIQHKQKQLDASAAVFHERAINEVLFFLIYIILFLKFFEVFIFFFFFVLGVLL